jgi:hypothetical protein
MLQYLLGLLFDDIDADICVQKILHLEIFSDLRYGLISIGHKVIGKLIETLEECLPGVIFGEQNNGVTHFFYVDLGT